MIIVKTKNGDIFINDKMMAAVEHVKDKAVVNCYGKECNGLCRIIENVEAVMYANDAQPASWKDEGSEIQWLKQELDVYKEKYTNLLSESIVAERERTTLKEQLKSFEEKASPDKWWPDYVDVSPVEAILGKIRSYGRNYGYDVKIKKILDAKNIYTVGELLRVGRREFKKYNQVGMGSIKRIDCALLDLYNINGW